MEFYFMYTLELQHSITPVDILFLLFKKVINLFSKAYGEISENAHSAQ